MVAPDPDDFARGIVVALNDEQERMRCVAAAKRLYEAKYSRAVYAAKMGSLLKRLS